MPQSSESNLKLGHYPAFALIEHKHRKIQGAHEDEAKEYDLPVVRQRRA